MRCIKPRYVALTPRSGFAWLPVTELDVGYCTKLLKRSVYFFTWKFRVDVLTSFFYTVMINTDAQTVAQSDSYTLFNIRSEKTRMEKNYVGLYQGNGYFIIR